MAFGLIVFDRNNNICNRKLSQDIIRANVTKVVKLLLVPTADTIHQTGGQNLPKLKI